MGSTFWGGACARVGYSYSFGSTEEHYRAKVFGTEAHGGVRGDRPLNHSTGVGWVRGRKGDYTVARGKGHTVVLLLHEIYGGLQRDGTRHLRSLSKAARTRDTTEYHDPPGGLRLSYQEHWGRALSAATALGDAFRVVHRLRKLPQLYVRPLGPRPARAPACGTKTEG